MPITLHTSTRPDASRRLFLRQAGALSALGAAGAPLALNLAAVGSAAAQSATDYKAVVCLFLFGGNDGINMVLPTDTLSWTNYSTIRNQAPDPIALLRAGTAPVASAAAGSPARLGGVLPIAPLDPQGRSFALHPLLGTLQTLFDSDRRLAIVPNVGPLVMPTTKSQYGLATHPKPAALFSHNDQQNTWQTFRREGSTLGWGGRMADLMAANNSRAVFTAISAAGNAVYLAGQSVQQYQVSTNGAIRLGADSAGKTYGSTAVTAALQRVVSGARVRQQIETDLTAVAQRSIDAEATLRTALARPASDPLFGTPPAAGVSYSQSSDPKLQYSNPLTGAKAANTLAQQLQIVARLIDARNADGIGARRQVFFVSLGGFDTHDLQNGTQADLLARLAQAMRYFDDTLAGLGMRDSVTTFTASDFGRTFTSNGDGTDHGWGSHHFVMGGAVKGGDLYGNFPVLGAKNPNDNNFDSSPNQIASGSLIPETSVDQLGATIASWFGLSDSQLLDVFPNLHNFDAAKRKLGFMA